MELCYCRILPEGELKRENSEDTILPDDLYKKEIECIMGFFNSLTSLLPCNSCKLSYMEYSKEPDTNIYDVNNFKTRNNVIKLLWKLFKTKEII